MWFFLVCAVIDYPAVSLSNKMNKFLILLPETKHNIYPNVSSAVGHISSISGKPNPDYFQLFLLPHKEVAFLWTITLQEQ